MDRQTENVQPQVFRFKFSNELMSEISYFSKLHSHDDRKTYQEEWKKWFETNDILELVNSELERLSRLGYENPTIDNINNKMYRSSRFYFRKKSSVEKVRAKCIRSLHNVSKNFIENIQKFIENEKLSQGFSPKIGYEKFISEHSEMYNSEIENLVLNGGYLKDDAIIKIKKTYKNKHYQSIHN